MKQQDDVLV